MTINPSPRSYEEMTAEIKDIFPNHFPTILKTAFDHSYLEGMLPLFKRVYRQCKAIKDPALIESLLTTALYHCSHQYCYIVHASLLLQTGTKLAEVKNLTELLRLPESIENRIKWNNLLKMTFYMFRDDSVTHRNIDAAKKLLTSDEFEDYTHILAFASKLKLLIYFFREEIDFEKEVELLTEELQIRDEIKDLVNYYETSKERLNVPVISMCMYCKDVRNSDGHWFPIEIGVKAMKKDVLFSHGVCDRCLSLKIEAN